MQKSEGKSSVLVGAQLGTVASLACFLISVVVLPGLEWRQWTCDVCYAEDGPYPYFPSKVWHLDLYGHSIYGQSQFLEQIPFQVDLLKFIVPPLSLFLFALFVVIYRRTYRPQFRE